LFTSSKNNAALIKAQCPECHYNLAKIMVSRYWKVSACSRPTAAEKALIGRLLLDDAVFQAVPQGERMIRPKIFLLE
jgi:hypothetical protein